MNLATASIAAASLSFVVPLPAQTIPDELWGGGNDILRLSRLDGRQRLSYLHMSLSPVRVGLDGRVWTIWNLNQQISVAWEDSRVARSIGTLTTNGRPLEIEPDGTGGVWVTTDQDVVEHWVGSPPALQNSYRLAGPPTAMTVDVDGTCWIGIQNQPAPLLSAIDPATGARLNATIPALAGERIEDLVADDRAPNSSHIWLVGGDHVVEVDPAITVISDTAVDLDGGAIHRAQLGLGDDLWIHGRASSLYRFDRTTRVAERFFAGPVQAVSLDAIGDLWLLQNERLFHLDAQTGELDREISWRGAPHDLDDGAGYYTARVAAGALDADGDGFDNRTEARAGTNYLDAQSSPRIQLRAPSMQTLAGDPFRISTSGELGYAFLTAGPPSGRPTQVPGILGELRLFPGRLWPIVIPVAVPGQLAIQTPASASLDVHWQAVYQRLGTSTLEFTNEVFSRVERPMVRQITETFDTDAQLDLKTSAGQWGGGFGVPRAIGGSGRLGSFVAEVGTLVAPDTYEWSTDRMEIPGRHTLTGQPIVVTDGVFEFSDLHIPAGITVRFRGSRPAVLKVRGTIRIDGQLRLDGDSPDPGYEAQATLFNLRWRAALGQSGTAGGAGGGSGGAGAEGCDGNGSQARYSGFVGESLQLPAGSGYTRSQVAATGGGGGPLFPATGLDADVKFNLFAAVCGQLAGGGAGGGWLTSGRPGRALRTFTIVSDLGPDSTAGVGVGFVPIPNGTSTLEHLLIGGSGGGGGGSQPLNMTGARIREGRQWNAGGGGTGGGGALALRAGSRIVLGQNSIVSARGGDGVLFDDLNHGPPSPGGGGSGGSIILQTFAMNSAGELDLSGGRGSQLLHRQFNGVPVESVGGDGAPGYVRLELPSRPSIGDLGRVRGAALSADNVGVLSDEDSWSGFQSRWYDSGDLDPDWLHYRVVVTTSTGIVAFTDDPKDFRPANFVGSPIRIYVQGARLDAAGEPIGSPGPWREFVSEANGGGLNADRASAFRFQILFDRSVTASARVDRLDVAVR